MAHHTPKRSKPTVRRLENERTAMELKTAGSSYTQIAATMGLSVSYVWKLIDAALKRYRDETGETIEAVRQQEVMRLDLLLVKANEQLKRAWCTKTAKVVLDIGQRRSQLLGLDEAVSRIEISGEIGKLSDNEIRQRALELLQIETSQNATEH